jgi:P-type conjugative transfer protein TrbG
MNRKRGLLRLVRLGILATCCVSGLGLGAEEPPARSAEAAVPAPAADPGRVAPAAAATVEAAPGISSVQAGGATQGTATPGSVVEPPAPASAAGSSTEVGRSGGVEHPQVVVDGRQVAPDVWRESLALGEGREPAVLQHGDDAQVPYGRHVPVVRCAPLRVCLIELEEDELVLNTVVGDSARWILAFAAAGPRGATPVLAVKPTECNLTTNLAVTTNRRIYQITLEAPTCGGEESQNPSQPYTHLLRFYYPEEFMRRVASAETAGREAALAEARSRMPLASASPTDLNFDYTWKRKGRFPWEPAAVFDDRVHTYVRLPGSGAGQESPVLFEVDAKGGVALVNYAVRGRYLVTDRVLDRGVLVLGAGRGERRLEITRGGR